MLSAFGQTDRCSTRVRSKNSVPARRIISSAPSRICGFALLEILVTMVIILVGLLGLAGVMARSSTAEMESYERVQAVILVQDMIDRLNANRKYATCYSNGSTGLALGTGYAGTPACTAGAAAQEQALAVADLTSWDQMLKGSAEVSGGTKLGAMIGARGCITQLDAANQIYRVSVAWQGFVTTATPVDVCGKDSYGTDSMRRVITMTVRIGKLS